MPRVSIAERLERNSIPEPNSGCLLWTSTVSKTSGHGRMKIAGKWHSPHRVAYVQKNGPIPDGMDVCHKCDVPICINDAHLWSGTHKDNMADMWRKGRGRWNTHPTIKAVDAISRKPKTVRPPMPIQPRSCGRCGVEIIGRNQRAKYCSNKCRWDVERTQAQRDRYNAARNAKARARRQTEAGL